MNSAHAILLDFFRGEKGFFITGISRQQSLESETCWRPVSVVRIRCESGKPVRR